MPPRHGTLKSFSYALEGLHHVFRTQPNFRLELLLGVLAIGASVWLRTGLTPILICTMIVLSLELLNTALEHLANAVTLEPRPEIKVAKDVAAGAVLLAAYFSVLVAIVELLPALWTRLGG